MRKFKAGIVLVIIAILTSVLFGCAVEFKNNGTYYSGNYDAFSKTWRDKSNETKYDNDIVADEESAKIIATAIFDCIEKDDEFNDYVPSFVFYDEDDEYWVVSFTEYRSEDVISAGGYEYSIAINKKDGKVLDIWLEFGE